MDKIRLENGKYELTFDEKTCHLVCKIYDEDWLEIPTYSVDGGKMMISWFYEMIELQKSFQDREMELLVSYNNLASSMNRDLLERLKLQTEIEELKKENTRLKRIEKRVKRRWEEKNEKSD